MPCPHCPRPRRNETMPDEALTATRVRELLDAMRGLPVLVLGDLMLDVYLAGGVERISPEGPVPVVDVRERSRRLGGAANVAWNLRVLEAQPRLVALRGDDEAGGDLAALLAERGIEAESLVTDPGRPTSVKTRILGGGQQVCRYDMESRAPAAGAALAALRKKALVALDGARAVVLSDYGKGVMADALVAEVIAAAGARGIPVVVDPKEGHFAAYRGADLVTPNRAEAGGSWGLPIRSGADLETVGRGLLERLAVRALMITLGADGIALFETGRPTRIFPAAARQVYDVTGAGDTVVSVLALALAAGAGPAEGAVLANHAAARVVARVGTAAVTPDELADSFLDAALGDAPRGADEGRVLARGDAAAAVAAARERGAKIAFTNGCFDLLHFGHLAILREAARRGDLLVVGINGDASIRRLKGAGRPVNRLAERARLLAGLRGVDLVVPFDEDTPLALIEILRPDVLVKGDEYEEDAIVGAAAVRGWGGEVVRFPMLQGYSTTDLLERDGNAADAPAADGGGGAAHGDSSAADRGATKDARSDT
ncbi:MAG: bifunctional heptose 7-phosphate kinase/heptose 1-phosphate adenyltransferase [Candidatus Krumholzibacteriota bacterium]|nr:bifunctional heptose 7-phosphate kinase/heptose 1-phosphate adenyltransferase [Candidatus Krumholzibacteriota bacterium]